MNKLRVLAAFLVAVTFLSACNLPSWQTYTNSAYGFALQYPSGGTLQPGDTAVSARIQLPITAGTNLAEKYLDISVQDGAASCESPQASGYAPGTLTPTSLTINGLTWVKENASEGAAGSMYDWTAYSTQSGSICVSLTFVLHSHNPGVYTTPPPTFNYSSESSVFILIVNTFHWLTSAAVTPTVVTCATASLQAPALLAPADGSVITILEPTLSWQYPDPACTPQGYRIDLSTDPTFADTSLSGGTGNPSTSWGPGHALADCTTYFWKVAGINDTTLGPASGVFTFRTNASGTCAPEATATVSGILWFDQCSVALDASPVPSPLPAGCVVDSYGVDADGIHQPSEPFMTGITVNLGPGDCPSGGPLSTVTDGSGAYAFTGLTPGKYCLNVNAASFLGPGGTGHWTLIPSGHEGNTYRSILVGAGEVLSGQDFAWYQFTGGPTPTPTAVGPTFTPTAVGPTFTPTAVGPTFTPTAVGMSFVPKVTPLNFPYIRSCNPTGQIDFSVMVSGPGGIRGLLLFLRLKNDATGAETPWNEGFSMDSQGNGNFHKALMLSQIPGLANLGRSSGKFWLEYQFVATGAGGGSLGRSPVYSDVSMPACK